MHSRFILKTGKYFPLLICLLKIYLTNKYSKCFWVKTDGNGNYRKGKNRRSTNNLTHLYLFSGIVTSKNREAEFQFSLFYFAVLSWKPIFHLSSWFPYLLRICSTSEALVTSNIWWSHGGIRRCRIRMPHNCGWVVVTCNITRHWSRQLTLDEFSQVGRKNYL